MTATVMTAVDAGKPKLGPAPQSTSQKGGIQAQGGRPKRNARHDQLDWQMVLK